MGSTGFSEDANLNKLLQEKFTSQFRSGYVKYGNVTMPKRYEELKEEIDNFEVFDDDVWICSFPKTGTTWSQEMVWLISNDCNYKAAEENLGARFPFLEVSAVFDFRDLKKNNSDFIPPLFLDDSIKFVREIKRPRFIKTHLPWTLLPKQIINGERKPKIIYITRNCKDTCISYFHHVRLFEGFIGSFQEFCALFMGNKVTFGPFWEHVLDFWQRRMQENILFVRYEDMKSNLLSVIQKVSTFLSKKIADDKIETLINHLSFEKMKLNPAVNFEPVLEFHRKFNLVKVDGVFMRSGKESHKSEMTREHNKMFDEWIIEHVFNTDFTL